MLGPQTYKLVYIPYEYYGYVRTINHISPTYKPT